MSQHPMKDTEEKRFERKMLKGFRELRNDPEWAKVHYTVQGGDNPRVEAFNQVMAEERKKKVN